MLPLQRVKPAARARSVSFCARARNPRFAQRPTLKKDVAPGTPNTPHSKKAHTGSCLVTESAPPPRDFFRQKYAKVFSIQVGARAAPKPDNAADGLIVGAGVQHARLLAGKRVRDLAEAISYNESMISKIESGRVVPSPPMLHKGVAALGREMSSFFGSAINAPDVVIRHGHRAVLQTEPLRRSPACYTSAGCPSRRATCSNTTFT